jgi:sugar/nucleoside kinase (ribokinase family)
MAEVICVGSAALEHVYEVPSLADGAETLFARDYRQAGAGNAANAAVATSRLGGSAVLWARLGDDETGDQIVADLVRYNVDISGLRRVSGARSALSSVLAAPDGRHQVTRFGGVGLPDAIDGLPLGRIQDASAVLAEPGWPEAARRALEVARDHRLPGVLAIGIAESPVPTAFAALASHVLFTPVELRRFTGEPDIDTALGAAAAATGTTVAVTSGHDGLRWREPGGAAQAAAPAAFDLVDPAATWDTFCAAFCLAIGEEKPFDTAVAFASTAAGLAGSARGSRTAMPDRRSVWQRIAIDFPAIAALDG